MDRKSGRRGLAAVLALVAAAACSRGAGPPGWPDIEVIPEDSVHEVGTSEVIARIADVARGPDGTFWILNTVEPRFVALAPNGAVLRAWGRNGGGPDEFQNPNVLVPGVDGVRVYDTGPNRLTRIDGSSEEPESLDLPRLPLAQGRIASTDQFGGHRMWIHATAAGILYAAAERPEVATEFTWLYNVRLTLLKPDGSTETPYPAARPSGDWRARYGENAAGFMPYPLWATCPDGTVAAYDPLTNVVRRLAANAGVTDSIMLPPERAAELTVDRFWRLVLGVMHNTTENVPDDTMNMRAGLEAEWEQIARTFGPVVPEYAYMHCTGLSTLWLQLVDADNQWGASVGPLWLRIDEDGPLRAFRLPDSFRAMRLESDRVLGIRRGEYDIESAAWMTLPGAR